MTSAFGIPDHFPEADFIAAGKDPSHLQDLIERVRTRTARCEKIAKNSIILLLVVFVIILATLAIGLGTSFSFLSGSLSFLEPLVFTSAPVLMIISIRHSYLGFFLRSTLKNLLMFQSYLDRNPKTDSEV